MQDPHPFEERVIELETRLAHNEQAIDDLTHIVRQQSQHIDALQHTIHQMRDRVARFVEAGDQPPQGRKPSATLLKLRYLREYVD